MRTFLMTLAGSLGLGLAAVSFGQDADLFTRLDADKDGVLTAAEVGEEKKALFERMLGKADKNGDGKLSKEEFAAGLQDAPPKDAPAAGGGPGGGFPPGDPKDILARIDKNGDGKIQKDEAPERMREGFDRIDGNKDGVIDITEFGKFAAMMRGEKPAAATTPAAGTRPEGNPNFPPFARIFDADGNGELSASEIAAAPEMLKKLDKNSDGKLTGEELLLGAGPSPAAQPGRPGGLAGIAAAMNPAEMFKRADANGDGKISKEEAPERLRDRFDDIDANKDGVLEQDEFRKMFERLREQFGKKKAE